MSERTPVRLVIQAIVERLITAYQPERIILFGSHAHGKADADSDIDLLVVKETEQEFLDRLDDVRRLATGTHRGIPFDPIVLTPRELQERLRRGDQFIAGILQTGEVLYAA
jgi:predicted nucleotidyltransferase